jgi:putative ABC transport system permease protein
VLRLEEARLESRALLFAGLLVLVATLLFAGVQLLTALRATPRQALASMGRGAQGSPGEARLRSGFLVTQLGFAMLLTVLTATMARSLATLNAVELGFRPDSVFVARVALPPRKYPDVPAVDRFARALEAELTSTPGIEGAGAISIAPYSAGLAIIPFSVVGRQPEHERERLEAHLRGVTPGYFGAVGARVREGRGFTANDDAAGAPVAIVSRALTAQYLADGSPVGRELLLNDNNRGPRPVTIVGVVDDMRHVRLDAAPETDIYVPMAQYSPDNAGFIAARHYWVARVGPAAAGYQRTFARALEKLDRDAAMAEVVPLRRLVDVSLAPRTYGVYALSWFAFVALVLTAIGVYGVVAYSVAQRRREIGVRLALGATARGIALRFVTSALLLGVVGLGIGVAGAMATRRLVSALLFGVSPTDPVIIAAVGAGLLAVTVIAAALPARRAASVDPAIALRDG